METEEPTRTTQQERESRLVFLGVCLVVVALFCGFAYGAWPGASTSDRRDAVLAFLTIVGIGVPLVIVVAAASVRAARRSAQPGRRLSKAVRGLCLGGALVFAGVLDRASWQLVGFAAFAAVMILVIVNFVVVFVLVSPEEAIRRRSAALD